LISAIDRKIRIRGLFGIIIDRIYSRWV